MDDVIVIGGGPGGYAAAIRAAQPPNVWRVQDLGASDHRGEGEPRGQGLRQDDDIFVLHGPKTVSSGELTQGRQ